MAEIQNKSIISRDVNFAEWYTSVITKADLVDYLATISLYFSKTVS